MTTATATYEHITREQALSEQERVRLKVARRVNQLTNDGDELIQFMLDTVRGEFHDAKFCHRQQAALNLAVMSGQLPQDTPGSDARVVREEDMPKPTKPKTTLKQIINKPLGAYIREETDDCVDLIDDYYDILFPKPVFESSEPDERKYQKATQVRANHRIAALKEMMRRAPVIRRIYRALCRPAPTLTMRLGADVPHIARRVRSMMSSSAWLSGSQRSSACQPP